jgi:hypothetical protein
MKRAAVAMKGGLPCSKSARIFFADFFKKREFLLPELCTLLPGGGGAVFTLAREFDEGGPTTSD